MRMRSCGVSGTAMRADSFFAEKYGSRTRAKAVLQKGLIVRGGRPLSPSDEVMDGDEFIFLSEDSLLVSRGGYKLERGLTAFSQNVENCVFADLGASTGGFCEVLLSRGARRVYAVDVGKGQLAPSLAHDPRVVVMDETNARYLRREDFDMPLDGVVSDLSFISLSLILPVISALLDRGGRAFVLFKPQFECGGRGLGKSGILPVKYHVALLSEFYERCLSALLAPMSIVNAPIHAKKNVEYIVFLQKDGRQISREEFLRLAAERRFPEEKS